VGEWKNAEPGKQIVTEGEPVSSVCIAITGSAEVRKQGERIGPCDRGTLSAMRWLLPVIHHPWK
jgi:hypothetical protein